jgi:hypothetical protein
MLPLLDSAGAKILKLEEVVGEQLEAEGLALAEAVVGHALTCFRSSDPEISLEPVAQRSVAEMEEAANASIQEAAKLVGAWFEGQPKDT